jgi:hydroxymethylpyrimidine pyrophosphatase-like HAD family hydrolase
MVKAVMLDVDGVIVGNKVGINFPLPSEPVINTFKNLRSKGLPIILCTSKFNYAILEIIKKAQLNNFHITDGGALIIDPLDNQIIKFTIDKNAVMTCTKRSLEKDIYIELYTPEAYYVQKTQVCGFTNRRTHILQKNR